MPEIEPCPQQAPAELRQRDQWLVWLLVQHTGKPKPDKVPHRPTDRHERPTFSSTDPDTWCSFGTARDSYVANGWSGVGFVFAAEDPYTGVDLDNCRVPETGEIARWAQRIIDRLSSYTEVSPSETGVKVWVRAKLPDDKGHKWGTLPDSWQVEAGSAVEMYDHARYFTVTGWRLEGSPAAVEERQAELEALFWELEAAKISKAKASGPPAPTEPVNLDDQELLDRAQRATNGSEFQALWNGDTSGYGEDHSRADLALCSMLMFWTGNDDTRVESLFRRSGLMREKWDRDDYRSRTLDKARQSEVYQPHRRRSEPTPATTSDGEPTAPVDFYRCTDTGNAERFAARHGGRVRYCAGLGGWYVWTRHRWEQDTTDAIHRLAKDTVRAIAAEAEEADDDKLREAIERHASKSESRSSIESMLSLARAEKPIPSRVEQWDRDPWLLAVRNGTVDLRTGELQPHDPARYITKLAPVVYDPVAAAPRWMAFLDEIMDGRRDLVEYLQRAVGYSLTGSTREHKLLFLHGSGRNGKSTFLNTIRHMLGDYASQAAPELLLMSRRGADGPTPEIARLRGARFVSTVEIEQGRRMAESFVKQLTGGDPLVARYLRENPFEFVPECKVWVATNHKPRVTGSDRAIWSRVQLVPFTKTIPREQRDPELQGKLEAEAQGILQWALAGCLSWQERGLAPPKEVIAATEEYREEEDVFGRFIADTCVVADDAEIVTGDLYKAYCQWCEDNGERAVTKKTLGQQLAANGFQRRRTGRSRFWLGLCLEGDARQSRLEGVQ